MVQVWPAVFRLQVGTKQCAFIDICTSETNKFWFVRLHSCKPKEWSYKCHDAYAGQPTDPLSLAALHPLPWPPSTCGCQWAQDVPAERVGSWKQLGDSVLASCGRSPAQQLVSNHIYNVRTWTLKQYQITWQLMFYILRIQHGSLSRNGHDSNLCFSNACSVIVWHVTD